MGPLDKKRLHKLSWHQLMTLQHLHPADLSLKMTLKPQNWLQGAVLPLRLLWSWPGKIKEDKSPSSPNQKCVAFKKKKKRNFTGFLIFETIEWNGFEREKESHKRWMCGERGHFKCTFTKSLYYVLTFSEFESVKQLCNSALTGSKSFLTAQNKFPHVGSSKGKSTS